MDPNMSPLHEALRGTTAVPVVNMLAQSNVHVPQSPNMMPAFDHSLPQYNMDIAPTMPPTPLFPSVLMTPPRGSTFESASFMERFMNHQAMLSSQQRFMTSSASEYSNLSADHLQTFPVKPLSSTPFLHEDPTAVVNTHLSVNVGFDRGHIFHGMPWPIPEVVSLPPSSCFPLESQHYSLKYMQKENQILESSSYKDPYGPSFGQFPVYPYAQWQQQMPINSTPNVTSDGMVLDATMSFAIPTKRVKHEYTCKVCDASFPTPQAYGGHMSSHSKAAKKNKLIMNDPSTPTSYPSNVSGASKVNQGQPSHRYA